MNTYADIDSYIKEFPEQTQQILQEMRKVIHETAPEAVEVISYAIPTFDLKGKHLVHFGGFKNHVSFFPTAEPTEIFAEELKGYATTKGTIQFKLDQPIPYDLVRKITKFRVAQILGNS